MAQITDEKEHYKSLISLFKYAITLVVSLITLIGAAVTYMVYGNAEEMSQDLRDKKADLQNQLDTLKSDLKYNEEKMSAN